MPLDMIFASNARHRKIISIPPEASTKDNPPIPESILYNIVLKACSSSRFSFDCASSGTCMAV